MNPTEQPIATNPVSPAGLGYGGFWLRVLAYLIDGLVLSVVSIALYFVGLRGDTVLFVLAILYFILLESSKSQATVGKMLCGLKVTDANGGRITIGRAAGRFFSKIISAIILGIGFMMVGFTERKQGLHDMIAKTFVVKAKKLGGGKLFLLVLITVVLIIVEMSFTSSQHIDAGLFHFNLNLRVGNSVSQVDY